MRPQIRKIVIQIEEIHNEIGKTVDPPARKTTVAAIIKILMRENMLKTWSPFMIWAPKSEDCWPKKL